MARGRTSTSAGSRTPKRTRKAKSDKTTAVAEVGHNSGPRDLTEDEQRTLLIGVHTPMLEKALAKFRSAQADYRNVKKLIKAEGSDPRDCELVLKLRDESGLEKVKREREREDRILNFMAAEIGTQFTLFDGMSRTPSVDLAFEAGRLAGIDGKDPSPPHAAHTPQGQKWMEGWHEGQRERREVLLKMKQPDVPEDSEFERVNVE